MATYPPTSPAYGDQYAQYSSPYPHQQEATRPPPPTGPPPAYDVRRIYPYTLRPVLLFTCGLSLLYLCITGAASIRDATRSDTTGKVKLFDFVEGGLYFGAAGVELFGLYSTWIARIPQARLYSLASVGAFGAVIAGELLDLITHFSYKSSIINACTTRNTGSVADSDDNFGGFFNNSDNNGVPLTADQASKLCNDQWKRESIWDVVWLLVSLVMGAIFVSFSFSFVRQLLDPSSVPARAPRTSRFQSPSEYGQNVPHVPYDAEAAAMYGPPSGPPPGVPPSGGGPPLYDGPGRGDADDKSPSGPGPSGARGYGYGYGMGRQHDEYEASRETLGGGKAPSSKANDQYDDDEDDRRSVDTVIDNGPEAERKGGSS